MEVDMGDIQNVKDNPFLGSKGKNAQVVNRKYKSNDSNSVGSDVRRVQSLWTKIKQDPLQFIHLKNLFRNWLSTKRRKLKKMIPEQKP